MEATGVDGGRRRAVGLGAWAAAVAGTGVLAARRRREAGGLATVDPGDPTTATTAAPPPPAPPPEVATPAPATTAAPAITPAPAPTAPPAAATTPDLPVPAPPPLVPRTGEALVLHVTRRATFGPTPALLHEIRTAGVDAWLDQQLRPWEIDDGAVEAAVARLPELSASARNHLALRRFGDDAVRDLRLAAVYRAVHGRRHLHEVLVDLWHDHLAASGAKSPTELHLNGYDAGVIRPNALGRFRDLLMAATTSAAMLEYLDTASSVAPDVNENHGRELLELHTVGRASGHTQDDVVGAARVLSGWTVVDDAAVVFDPARHDPSPASVLGWSTPGRTGPGAASDTWAMLDHLAHHPATARRIAGLLLTRFVADEPPEHLVAATADAYLAAGTDIAATLRHVFASPELRAGPPLTRRPLDLLAAQLRATGARIDLGGNALLRLLDGPPDAAGSLHWLLALQRQPLFWALNPSGHPKAGRAWLGGDALLHRWRAADVIANGLGGVEVDADALLPGTPAAGAAVDALGPLLLGEPFSPATRVGAFQALGHAEADPLDGGTKRALLAFLLASPELQSR